MRIRKTDRLARENALLVIFCGGLLISVGMTMALAKITVRASDHAPIPVWLSAGYHLFCLLIGYGAMLVFGYSTPRNFRPLALPLFCLVSCLLGLAVMQRRNPQVFDLWRYLGQWFIPAQATEMCKLATIFFLAHWLARQRRTLRLNNLQQAMPWGSPCLAGLLLPAAAIIIMCLLLLFLHDSSTCLLIAAVSGVLLLMGGVRWRVVLPIYGMPALALAWCLWSNPMSWARLQAFYSSFYTTFPQPGHRMLQNALSRGGWTGVGLGEGRLRYWYPAGTENNFMLATIGEDLGLQGVVAVGVLLVLLLAAGILISGQARDQFSRLLAGGFAALVGMQALLHLAFVASWLPIGGVALPFASGSGPDQCLMMIGIGLLIAIARDSAGIR